MCGLIAVISKGIPVPPIANALQRISHRGPDSRGQYSCDWYSVGMCRLSIVDVANGDQPIFSDDSTAGIILNGEVYNHESLRQSLHFTGRHHRTQSDTETILYSYLHENVKSFEKLEGMYSFIIFEKNKLVLHRDKFGIKPLYIYENEDFIFVSSEIKAIIVLLGRCPDINKFSLLDIYITGHINAWETLFQGISQLPPGEILTIERSASGITKSRSRLSKDPFSDQAEFEFEGHVELLGNAIQRSVEQQRASEVRSAFLLSGGLDSSILYSYSRTIDGSSRSASIAEEDGSPDKAAIDWISQNFCLPNSSRFTYGYGDFIHSLDEMVLNEETLSTFSASGVLQIAKKLKDDVKVVFSGEGADELFGGYNYYVSRATFVRAQSLIRSCHEAGIEVRPETISLVENVLTPSSFDAYFETVRTYGLSHQLYFNHLSISDKHFMSQGIECRVPYLDSTVVSQAMQIPVHQMASTELSLQKVPLKFLSCRLSPLTVFAGMRQKTGFPSVSKSYRERLKNLTERYVRQSAPEYADILPSSGIAAFSWDLFYQKFRVELAEQTASTTALTLLESQSLDPFSDQNE